MLSHRQPCMYAGAEVHHVDAQGVHSQSSVAAVHLASPDIKAELAKLNKGLLFLFLELLTVLVQQSSAYSSAVSPVLVALHNMMHLINMARHHQVWCDPLACMRALCSHRLGSLLYKTSWSLLAAGVRG